MFKIFDQIYNLFHGHYRRRYHGIYNHARQLFIFDLFLLSFAVALFGAGLFLFFWKPGVADLVPVTITLGGDRVRSGDLVRVNIAYENNSKVSLQKSILTARLPPGFVPDEKSRAQFVNGSLPLGDLAPGAKGQVQLTGQAFTPPGSTEHIFATLSYTQAGGARGEQSLGAFLLSLPGSTVRINATMPTAVYVGTPAPITVTVANDGELPANHLRLVARPKVTLPAESKNFSLPPHSSTTFAGSAVFATSTAGQIISLTVLINLPLTGELPLYETAVPVEIYAPTGKVAIAPIGVLPFAEAGQTIPLTITWKNTNNFALQKATVSIEATPGIVNLNATARENNLTREGNRLLITPRVRTLLTALPPGAEDSLNVRLILNNTFETDADVRQLTLLPSLEFVQEKVPGQIANIKGVELKIPLASDVSLASEVRYYSDDEDQLGRGPLPPRVGQTTKYWVLTEMANSINALKNLRFTAILAPGVVFTGKQSVTVGTELNYDAASQTVSWEYPLLPADSQTGWYFEVAVTPGAGQVGSTLTLIKKVRLEATDDAVGKKYDVQTGVITNKLPATDKGKTRGATVGL